MTALFLGPSEHGAALVKLVKTYADRTSLAFLRALENKLGEIETGSAEQDAVAIHGLSSLLVTCSALEASCTIAVLGDFIAKVTQMHSAISEVMKSEKTQEANQAFEKAMEELKAALPAESIANYDLTRMRGFLLRAGLPFTQPCVFSRLTQELPPRQPGILRAFAKTKTGPLLRFALPPAVCTWHERPPFRRGCRPEEQGQGSAG